MLLKIGWLSSEKGAYKVELWAFWEAAWGLRSQKSEAYRQVSACIRPR